MPKPTININKEEARKQIDAHLKSGSKIMTEETGSKVLQAYGIPVLPGDLATTSNEAASIAAKIGFPVVMKIISDDIIHKSDVGGVALNLTTEESVSKQFSMMMDGVKQKMPAAVIRGVYISKMASPGEEVILGIKRDPSFGPVVMFGLGGIFVEVFRDVSFKVAPVSGADVDQMIAKIKGYKLLTGTRGKKPRDIARIKECIFGLAALAVDFPEISELDINPMLVYDEGKGCVAADAKIMFT